MHTTYGAHWGVYNLTWLLRWGYLCCKYKFSKLLPIPGHGCWKLSPWNFKQKVNFFSQEACGQSVLYRSRCCCVVCLCWCVPQPGLMCLPLCLPLGLPLCLHLLLSLSMLLALVLVAPHVCICALGCRFAYLSCLSQSMWNLNTKAIYKDDLNYTNKYRSGAYISQVFMFFSCVALPPSEHAEAQRTAKKNGQV